VIGGLWSISTLGVEPGWTASESVRSGNRVVVDRVYIRDLTFGPGEAPAHQVNDSKSFNFYLPSDPDRSHPKVFDVSGGAATVRLRELGYEQEIAR
jgi:hypothetical protein